jgi:hypothetical protein
MALKVRDVEVLRVVISIGGVEVDHFALWHDKMGNAASLPPSWLSRKQLMRQNVGSRKPEVELKGRFMLACRLSCT